MIDSEHPHAGRGLGALRLVEGADLSSIDAHLAHLARLNRRPGTIRQRRWALLRLERFLHPHPINDANVDQLRAFLDRKPYAAETMASQTIHVCRYYQWLAREGHRFDDPTVRLEKPARTVRLPRPMPDEYVTRALHEAPEPIRSWFYLAAYAGLRACEIGPIRGEDIVGNRLIIREQKGGDMATVPLSPILLPLVARYPRKGWWFPHRGRGPKGPTSAGQVQRHANHWLHDHDIDHTLHTLRHWFGTQVYRQTRDLKLTQELMRHRSSASTDGYVKLSPGDGDDAVGLLPAM
ncbi:MAG TPA: tyrosine-type recombinase/integrase [Gemmatimonadaceae bacterium]|nr:tyrosine-type recombinase/integrase [Gemmatimonadaceae bacterium]